MTRLVPAAVLLLIAVEASPQDVTHSCVVIQQLSATIPTLTTGDRCATALSPASTFKIPHALMALEIGVVSFDSVEKWDGTRYDRQLKWNRDHSVISALKPSVLWVFQRIAPRIGAARASAWLGKFGYGNRDVSGPIDQYWVNGRLQISAPQQVAFLTRFFAGTLPVRREFVDAVREGLRQRTGTVENSLGVQPLKGDWRATTLFAKTGATTTAAYRVSWLVGMLQKGGRQYVFASMVWKEKGDVDSLAAAHLAASAFVDAGLLPSGQ